MTDLIDPPDRLDESAVNLTELERASFDGGVNVADGHARHELTPAQREITDRLPELFAEAAAAPENELDRSCQHAVLGALGQHTAVADCEILSCYSSSLAMEILGRALHAAGIRRVAAIHPTFDNIPDILRGIGLTLLPVPEKGVLDGSARLPAGTEVLLITTPNNPTGRVLSREALTLWAERCAAGGVVLVLDASFRGFDPAAQYDSYAVLAAAGCRYVVVEDTGKLWPTLDLKIGMLVFDPGERLPLRRIYSDILLGVSPLILALVREFARDAAAGGFTDLHRMVATRRDVLRSQLVPVGTLWFPDPDSRISVDRIALPPGLRATEVWRHLRRQGVHVLPCRQFHWADPESGERCLRIALGRPVGIVATAAAALRDYLG